MSCNGRPPVYREDNGSSVVPSHPKATSVLILGILGIICCGFLSPAAWIMASSAYKGVNLGQYAESKSLKIGRILGVSGTVLFLVWIVTFGILVINLGAEKII